MTSRLMLMLIVTLIVLLLAWLAFTLADNADDTTVRTVRVDSPWIEAAYTPPSTTIVARARTAPTVRTQSVGAAARVHPVGELQDMIRAGFARFGPDVAEQAIRVAGCESTGDETGQRLNPQAVNGPHAGLFQLSRTYHEARATRLGFTWAQMFEPGPNIAVAADIFGESRWGPWTCRWAA